MPAFVNNRVGSPFGRSAEEGTIVCPFFLKYSKKAFRMSLAFIYGQFSTIGCYFLYCSDNDRCRESSAHEVSECPLLDLNIRLIFVPEPFFKRSLSSIQLACPQVGCCYSLFDCLFRGPFLFHPLDYPVSSPEAVFLFFVFSIFFQFF